MYIQIYYDIYIYIYTHKKYVYKKELISEQYDIVIS